MSIYKGSSCGSTCLWIPEFPHKFNLKLGHFVFHLPMPFKGEIGKEFGRDFAVIMSQIALVQDNRTLPRQMNEAVNVPVFGKRFSDVINLEAFILFFSIRKKENPVKVSYLGRQINKFTFWRFPYTMKFSLDKNLRPLPNSPANTLFSAVSGNMLWNDVETFIDWFSRQRPQWDKEGFVLRNLVAK